MHHKEHFNKGKKAQTLTTDRLDVELPKCPVVTECIHVMW